jgi:hypothetical protein
VVSRSKSHCELCRFHGSTTQYVVPGIVDGAKAREKHSFLQRHEIPAVLHWHSKGDACNEKCEGV